MADTEMSTACAKARIAGLREAAGICRRFAEIALGETSISGDRPEHDAAMSCANLIENAAARAAERLARG